jgi:[ribosomal protein S18]-alanine N-acetyltransferase
MDLSKLIIKKMSEQNIEDIIEIEKLHFPNPLSRNSFLCELNNNYSYFFVVFFEERAIGYFGFHIIFDEAELLTICVKSEYSREGIGSFIIKTIFEKCKSANVKKIFLEVRSENLTAINLYKKNGFKEIGIRKNYYSRPIDDALIMERNL